MVVKWCRGLMARDDLPCFSEPPLEGRKCFSEPPLKGHPRTYTEASAPFGVKEPWMATVN